MCSLFHSFKVPMNFLKFKILLSNFSSWSVAKLIIMTRLQNIQNSVIILKKNYTVLILNKDRWNKGVCLITLILLLWITLNTFLRLIFLKITKVENNNKNYVNLYHLIKSNVMPAATMFSKFKSGNQALQNPIETNPINQFFEILKPVACAGPELVWKIYDAYRKTDGKVSNWLFLITFT